jgi:hypothetical protein
VIRRVRPSLSRLSGGRAFHLPASLLVLLAASCAETTDTTTTTSRSPTSITIEPSSFLGSVVCSNQPGALKSYVATLSEIQIGKPAIELASSPPIPCSQAMSFRHVLDGRHYTMAIDGYDVPASSLVPCGGPGSGSRYMLPALDAPSGACADALIAGKAPVVPRWRTGCGNISSMPSTNDEVASCDVPLSDSGTEAPAGITIDPRAALGMLACVSDGGTITRFDIKADDPNQTNHLGLDCGTFASLDPQTFSYTKNLVPGATYTFHLGAHVSGEVPPGPQYTAECSAVARAGFTVPAVCGPFTQP